MNNTTVNIDAMFEKADFGIVKETNNLSYESINMIAIKDLSGLLGLSLRKPDFQRETNQWRSEQVVSLIECFINGDLIPGVILWKSPSYLFVIDGGHRLSALKAWIEDDYGDGPKSLAYFGGEISKQQKKAANQTRKMIQDRVGSYKHFETKIQQGQIDEKSSTIIQRGIPVQWVNGDIEKAEKSFFKINTQGTPLDEIEEALLQNRRKPIAIAARAIIRAGFGHKYWSKFDSAQTIKIEEYSKQLHETIFDPELSSPVKTLDLPHGGSKGIRQALSVLIELISSSVEIYDSKPKKLAFGEDDVTGEKTVEVLKETIKVMQRISGNENGSLGLHPAIYFYGPNGSHIVPMFLGTARVFSRAIKDNNKDFFRRFTDKREKIERVLIKEKDLIASVIQKNGSKKRVRAYENIFKKLIDSDQIDSVTQSDIVEWGGVNGKVIVGSEISNASSFSDDTKSRVFIHNALLREEKCPICHGYIDVAKSVSYDHIQRKEDGGNGSHINCQLTHPYCNQSMKN